MQCFEIQMWIQGAQRCSKNSKTALLVADIWSAYLFTFYALQAITFTLQCVVYQCNAQRREDLHIRSHVYTLCTFLQKLREQNLPASHIPSDEKTPLSGSVFACALYSYFCFIQIATSTYCSKPTQPATQIFLQGTTDWNHRKWFADVAFLALQFPKPQE